VEALRVIWDAGVRGRTGPRQALRPE